MDSKGKTSRWTVASRVVVAGLSVLPGVVAIVACIWRPDALAALTLIPSWCWLVAGFLTLPFVWRTRQTRLLLVLTGLWIAFACGWVDETRSLARLAGRGILASESPQGQRLRVVSFNCGGSERSLADLQRVNPDVVLLQEAPGAEALARMSSGLFAEAGEYCTGGDVAILARGTVRNVLADEPGTFVAARLQIAGGPEVQCVSLRLSPPSSRLDPWRGGFWAEHRQLRQTHRRQLAEIRKRALAKQPSRAVIVGGDFNMLPLDAALDQLRPELADSFIRSGLGWGATGTNDWPLFRVDQIWTSGHVAPTQTFASKAAHSDHRMVICDVLVRE
jgi:endonuclease/exonuclease/phosphatase (EEP) superfamily protein YafD